VIEVGFGKFTVLASVPVIVRVLPTANVFPLVRVNVPVVVVIVSPSIVPGRTNAAGMEIVQVIVVVPVQVPVAVIWFAVPERVTLVTVPLPATPTLTHELPFDLQFTIVVPAELTTWINPPA
jgi:hypothetical protein